MSRRGGSNGAGVPLPTTAKVPTQHTASAAPQAPSAMPRICRAPIAGGGWVVASAPIEPRRRAVTALILALVVTAVPLFVAVAALSRTIARRALLMVNRFRELRRDVLNQSAAAGDIEHLHAKTNRKQG